MKKIILVFVAVLAMVTVHAKSEVVTLAWDYTVQPNILFTVYMSTNSAAPPSFVVATTTNTTVSITNTFTGILQYWVTARNTLTLRESPPSNLVIVPPTPAIPANMRLISITIGP